MIDQDVRKIAVEDNKFALYPSGAAFGSQNSETSGPRIATDHEWLIKKTRKGWRFTTPEEDGEVPDLAGVQNLVQLVCSPGVVVSYADLCGDEFQFHDPRSVQPTYDEEGWKKINEKLARFDSEIAEAERDGDEVAADDSRQKREELLARVKVDTKRGKIPPGPSGLPNKPGTSARDLNNPLDRLRVRIRNRLNDLYTKLASEGLPKLAAHFKGGIEAAQGRGYWYDPPKPAPVWLVQDSSS